MALLNTEDEPAAMKPVTLVTSKVRGNKRDTPAKPSALTRLPRYTESTNELMDSTIIPSMPGSESFFINFHGLSLSKSGCLDKSELLKESNLTDQLLLLKRLLQPTNAVIVENDVDKGQWAVFPTSTDVPAALIVKCIVLIKS